MHVCRIYIYIYFHHVYISAACARAQIPVDCRRPTARCHCRHRHRNHCAAAALMLYFPTIAAAPYEYTLCRLAYTHTHTTHIDRDSEYYITHLWRCCHNNANTSLFSMLAPSTIVSHRCEVISRHVLDVSRIYLFNSTIVRYTHVYCVGIG